MYYEGVVKDHMDFDGTSVERECLKISQTKPKELVSDHIKTDLDEQHHPDLHPKNLVEGAYILLTSNW